VKSKPTPNHLTIRLALLIVMTRRRRNVSLRRRRLKIPMLLNQSPGLVAFLLEIPARPLSLSLTYLLLSMMLVFQLSLLVIRSRLPRSSHVVVLAEAKVLALSNLRMRVSNKRFSPTLLPVKVAN
jgi:uncharacterized protein YhhL (DUF1145 family)